MNADRKWISISLSPQVSTNRLDFTTREPCKPRWDALSCSFGVAVFHWTGSVLRSHCAKFTDSTSVCTRLSCRCLSETEHCRRRTVTQHVKLTLNSFGRRRNRIVSTNPIRGQHVSVCPSLVSDSDSYYRH
jgi:hypothetical protein